MKNRINTIQVFPVFSEKHGFLSNSFIQIDNRLLSRKMSSNLFCMRLYWFFVLRNYGDFSVLISVLWKLFGRNL